MLPLLAAALPLLPKIPALAKTVAGIFGKKVPDSIEKTIGLVGEVTGMVERGEVPPEQMAMMEASVMEHKEEIMKLQNERADIERQSRKDQMGTTVALWGQEVTSQNKYVSETRPKILRQMFWLCAGYACGATLAVAILAGMGKELTTVVDLAKWIGGSLFGTFSAAFLGYTTARTVDKKNPGRKDTGDTIGKLMKMVL